MSLKFCPKCGNELESGSSFCDSCGANLGTRTETPDTISPGLAQTTQEPKAKPETIYYPDFLKRVIAWIFDSMFIGIIGSIFSLLLINYAPQIILFGRKPWKKIGTKRVICWILRISGRVIISVRYMGPGMSTCM